MLQVTGVLTTAVYSVVVNSFLPAVTDMALGPHAAEEAET
jgi:hypothetical protein